MVLIMFSVYSSWAWAASAMDCSTSSSRFFWAISAVSPCFRSCSKNWSAAYEPSVVSMDSIPWSSDSADSTKAWVIFWLADPFYFSDDSTRLLMACSLLSAAILEPFSISLSNLAYFVYSMVCDIISEMSYSDISTFSLLLVFYY